MPNIAEVLAELASQAGEGMPHHDDEPSTEEQVAFLKTLFDAYSEGCPFQPGEYVTPREQVNIKGTGLPHIVMETRPYTEHTFVAEDANDVSSSGYGRRLDMRIAVWARGAYACFWVESWQYERWTAA